VTTTARCTAVGYDPGCGWTTEGDTADRDAERHTRTTGHATSVTTTHDKEHR